MCQFDVKNVMKGRREGEKEEDQLGFGVLIQLTKQTLQHSLQTRPGSSKN